ncbi:MAG: hypothetical protein GY909_08880 [Oligoflexia bacterium]|nr:hypothetical protein [Oligoflexia bacterium]
MNCLEVAKNNLKFLEEIGFECEIVERKSLLEGDDHKYNELHYIFEKMHVEVSYHKFVNTNVLIITIGNVDEKKYLGFDDYLKFKGVEDDKYYCSLNLSDEECIKKTCSLFKKYVDLELGDVLKGSSWIVVPIDYK